jgi:regulator of PEP synthase PpsR (kinase-PPPase family)
VDTIRQLLEKKCEENGIFCVDLFGPMMKLLSEKLTMPPVEVPGIYQRNDEQYFKFCRAVEFALDHDDGANPSGWVNADAILLGVSRVGKSPLSVFLGTLGLKVANYPICPGVELPDAINKVDRRRVFGLLVDPEILAEHREDRRQRTMMRSMATGYSNMKQVMQELEDVEEMFKKRKFVKINVTGMPMESVADRIIKLLGDRFSEYSFDDEPVLNKRYQPL